MSTPVRNATALTAVFACALVQVLPGPVLALPVPERPFAPELAHGGTQDTAMAQGGNARRPAGGGQRARPSGGGAHAGGGRPQVRSGAATNVNHNVDRNRNVNRNVDRNVNRNVNVNVHNDYHGGGYYHDDWDDWDDHWHPVATMAVAATTAAVVGSIVRSVPPSCTTTVVNGVSYSQCGSTWYQPQYVGSSVQYVVVNPPR